MKRTGLPPVLAVLIASCLMSARAQADEAEPEAASEVRPDATDEERAVARELYAQGAAAFESGDFEEALAKFQACYDTSRLSALLFNIGSSFDRLGRPGEAVNHYTAYLAVVSDADNRQYVESRIILLQAEIDAAEPDPVDPIDPIPLHIEPQVVAPPPSGPSRTGPVILLATGGAAAVGAVVTGILARGSRSDLDDACVANVCSPELRSTHDAMKRQALLTDVLGGLALGLVTAGVLWWVLQPSGDAEDEDQAQVEFGCSFQACNARVQW